MRLTLLSAHDLRTALPMPAAIAAMQAAYADLSTGQATVPLRTPLPIPVVEGITHFMPAYLPASGLGAKIVSVFPRNVAQGKPIINGIVIALDPLTGEPLALCDGGFLTAWRTGAAGGAGAALLARPDAKTAAIFGTGVQAETQALAIDAARALDTIHIYSRNPDNIQKFIAKMQPEVKARLIPAASPTEAVRDADVICTATTSHTPVFDGHDLKPGAHISGVGSFTLAMRELDETTITRARIFIDSREPALAEAGELVAAMHAGKTHVDDWTELGLVAVGQKPGRQAPEDITFFKSVGVAVQDVAALSRALKEAQRLGLGTPITL